MKTVLVLMSTFNGERYLREQIESVFAQIGVGVTLLIRDDGSKDNTIKIVEDLREKYSNIILLKSVNCKSAMSFMKLMQEAYCSYSDYDYFAFCDQDDVWKSTKLLEAINKLTIVQNTKPSLYIGSYQMVDAELNEIKTQRYAPSVNLPAAMVSNAATGCTMVFNKSLLEKIVSRKPKDIIMHDYWVYLVCLCLNGIIFYDDTPYILYRQHNNNVIGDKRDSFYKRWCVRLKKLFITGDHFKSKLATSLLTCYSEEMNDENREFLRHVSTCRKWRSKYYLLFNPCFRGRTIDKNLQTIGLVLSGKF